MRPSSLLRAILTVVALFMASTFATETASAQCPPGDSLKIVTVPISCTGGFCLVDISYCYHPAAPTSYQILSYTRHPGQCTCDSSHRLDTMLKAIREWCVKQKECELWCHTPGLFKQVVVSQPKCFKNPTSDPNHWSGCEGTGECIYTYTLRCDGESCTIVNTALNSTGTGCLNNFPAGCIQTCPN